MKENLLHIKNLKIGYKKALTEAININANSGDFICIIGKNGKGKSTLLNTIAGVLPSISGSIFYNQKDIKDINLSERSTLISYVPSKQEYLSNLKVIDLVYMGRAPYTNIFDRKTAKDNAIVEKAIESFEIKELKHKSLYAISDGERQRAMICRAFVQQTPIILLDEPTAFLDYYAKHKLLSELHKLASENNKCVIFSSHDLDIAFKFANIIWLVHNNTIKVYTKKELQASGILKKIMNFSFPDKINTIN